MEALPPVEHVVIYASRATAPLTDLQLVDLLAQARDRNAAAGVTGLLLYAGDSFLQLLEGPTTAVDVIFGSIWRDRRHTDLRVLADRSATTRAFGSWSMGFAVPTDAALVEHLPGYQPEGGFPLLDPALVTDATRAEAFLRLYAGRASLV